MSLLPLETPRLHLRDFVADDLDAVQLYAGDPEVTRHLRWGPNDLEATRELLAEAIRQQTMIPRTDFALAVVRKENDELIGSCGLHLRGLPHEREIGYALRRDRWSQGYAGEIVAALVRFAFEGLGMERLTAAVDRDNPASERVLARAGFTLTGKAVDAPRACEDAGLWVLTRDELPTAGDTPFGR